MIELHRKLIGDHVRNEAFFQALKQVIVPGKTTVLDLGSGTGFLGFLASRLGAKHVTMVEVGDMLEISEALAKRNKIRNCTFIHAHSTDLPVMEQFDVIVSETLGNYALEENIIETMEDAKRFLQPRGMIIPRTIKQQICPITSDRLAKEIDVWTNVGYDLDFSEARNMSLNNIYVKTVRPSDLLQGEIKEWDIVDFSKKNTSIRQSLLSWSAEKHMTIYGFALWWKAELIPGIAISTSPFKTPTHWEQIVLPLLSPVQLKPRETLMVQLKSDTRWEMKINLSWTVAHVNASGKRLSNQEMDMRRG